MRKALIVVSMLSLALFAGCGKKEATCENALKNAMDIMMKEAPAAERDAVKAMADGMMAEGIKECEAKKPSAEDLSCAANAKTMADLQKCGKGLF